MGISLNEAIREVRKYNPVFDRLFDDTHSLEKYSRSLFDHAFQETHLKRQQEYKHLIKKWIDNLFIDDDDPPKITFADSEGFIACTTEHLNILNYPGIVGGHVMVLLSTLLQRKQFGDMVFLATSLVPLNDPLNRRGVNFRGQHINLFSKRDKHKVVYALPCQEISIVDCVQQAGLKSNFTAEEMRFLENIDRQIQDIDISNCRSYAEQLVKINYYLWRYLFAQAVRSKTRQAIIIPHDVILNEYLINYFFPAANQNMFIWRMLFESTFREQIIERFADLYGCWSVDRKKGTHFFWYLHKGEMRSMWLRGDILEAVDHDGAILDSISLQPDMICQALREQRIVSSIFVKFGLVNFWMGAKLMGGPGTTQFATDLKQAWLDILNGAERDLVKTIDTTGMSFGDTLFEYNSKWELRKMSGLDACYKSPLDEQYIENLCSITVKEVVLPTLEMLYFRLVPPNQRQEAAYSLAELTYGFRNIV